MKRLFIVTAKKETEFVVYAEDEDEAVELCDGHAEKALREIDLPTVELDMVITHDGAIPKAWRQTCPLGLEDVQQPEERLTCAELFVKVQEEEKAQAARDELEKRQAKLFP